MLALQTFPGCTKVQQLSPLTVLHWILEDLAEKINKTTALHMLTIEQCDKTVMPGKGSRLRNKT